MDPSQYTAMGDGTYWDSINNVLVDGNGNVVSMNDPSLTTTSPNPAQGNNNQSSNVPTIAGSIANFGTNVIALLSGRTAQTPTLRTVAPGQSLAGTTQISAGMILLLVIGAVLIFKVLK